MESIINGDISVVDKPFEINELKAKNGWSQLIKSINNKSESTKLWNKLTILDKILILSSGEVKIFLIHLYFF